MLECNPNSAATAPSSSSSPALSILHTADPPEGGVSFLFLLLLLWFREKSAIVLFPQLPYTRRTRTASCHLAKRKRYDKKMRISPVHLALYSGRVAQSYRPLSLSLLLPLSLSLSPSPSLFRSLSLSLSLLSLCICFSLLSQDVIYVMLCYVYVMLCYA